jgi:alkylation response protein AidB-like acyl-CoA dehydrogenase
MATTDDSTEDREFRSEVRTWLMANIPSAARPEEGVEAREFDLAWQRKQYDGGWAGISWPKEYGGRGLTLTEQMIWHEEYANASAPYVGTAFVGLNHGGPTLILRGDDAQRAKYLPPILRGEVVWCQGFSEPEAGSDLASLRTTGVIDGDDLVVNGRKIWTSYGQYADNQVLLVRTDQAAERHRGLTWVIGDMHLPGIEIRPIETMVGTMHFCEVTYDNVRIPLDHVVGGLDNGWSVAMSTLSFERGTAFISEQVRLARRVDELIDVARTRVGSNGRPVISDDTIADQLGELKAEVNALRAMTYAGISQVARTGTPGPEGSLIRLYFSALWQRVYATALEVIGDDILTDGLDGPADRWTYDYLDSFRATLGAGTSDIQKNVIGERVLGLPRQR